MKGTNKLELSTVYEKARKLDEKHASEEGELQTFYGGIRSLVI